MSFNSGHKDRQIRVFISSTFVDMVEDRNYLVKFIFPKLRRICESRCVTFGEVDLRWGISPEDADQGKVIPLCLAEIDKSRPYFIGLLGDRYGWIPKEEDYNLSLIPRPPWSEDFEGEKSDWLKKYQWKKSATELEILYGVLEAKGMENRAFFYFRDLNYTWPGKYVYKRESDEDQQSLVRLKNNIKSNFPVKDGYDSLEDLGKWVLRDFTDFINKNWPEDSQPFLLDREAMDHEAFALSRKRAYIGREEYYRKLDAHADGLGNQPLVVVGESGSGKSALLANWSHRYRESNPGSFLLMHFIGGTPQSSDWASLLRRILGEFNRNFGINQEIPDQPDALRVTFANSLNMVAAHHRVVIILDALNQLDDREGAQDLVWMPPVIPEKIRFIVSTLSGRIMEAIEKNGWQLGLKIEPLCEEERKQFITKFLGDYGKNVSEVVNLIAEHKETRTRNPLFLRALLEELRVFGDHKGIKERVTHYLSAKSIPDLYYRILTRWEEDYGRGFDLVRRSMALLWAARRGLSEKELLEAMGEVNKPLPHAYWSPIFLAAGDSLVNRGGLLTFFHDYLREAVREKYLPTESEQKAIHRSLANYFEKIENTNKSFLQTEKNIVLQNEKTSKESFTQVEAYIKKYYYSSRRSLDELPWQLIKAKEWSKLYNFLCNVSIAVFIMCNNRNDIYKYWTALYENTSSNMVDAYSYIIERPVDYHPVMLLIVSEILAFKEHFEEAKFLSALGADRYFGKNDLEFGRAINRLANIIQDNGNSDEGALKFYTQAENIFVKLKSQRDIGMVLNNKADIIKKLKGICLESLKYYDRAITIFNNIKAHSDVVIPIINKASMYRMLKKYDIAIKLYEEVKTICQENGNQMCLAFALNNQGNIFFETSKFEKALKSYKEAEIIFRDIGHIKGLITTLKNHTIMQFERREDENAMGLINHNEQLFRERGNINEKLFLTDLTVSMQ